MKIKLDKGAFAPERAHGTDAGMDLRVPGDMLVVIPAGKSTVIDTGVHVELPHGTFGKIESKSGLNVKDSVVSCGGVIDEGYSGSIAVKLYNFGKTFKVFQPGDKIAQLLICPVLYEDCEIVEEIQAGDRGDNGFGSTGR